MKNETPTALGRREGGRIVRSSSDVPTPNRYQSQPPEYVQVPAGIPPGVHRTQLLERADLYEVTAGLEAFAVVWRKRADLISRGCFIQARPR